MRFDPGCSANVANLTYRELLRPMIDAVEWDLLHTALQANGGDRSKAAGALKINRRSFSAKMRWLKVRGA